MDRNKIDWNREAYRKARNKAKLIYEWVKTDAINYKTFEYLLTVTIPDDAILNHECRND